MSKPEKRYAIVRNADSRRHAEAYLPENYRVIAEVIERNEEFFALTDPVVVNGYETSRGDKIVYVIEGRDVAGWTMHDYVIPRYASGLVWAEEIDLSHPVMKRVPLAHRSDRIDPDHPLTRASRDVNAVAEKFGIETTLAQIGMDVEIDQYAYLAKQRALRAVAAAEGVNLGEPGSEHWTLPPDDSMLMVALTAAYMDGLAIGWHAARLDADAKVPA